MSRLARTLVLFVIVFHLSAFVMEAFLWMGMPAEVRGRLLERLSDVVSVSPDVQASILRRLFVNQGFANLFVASAGIAGLSFVRRRNATAGYALIGYMCLSAIGAGVVLAVSTGAYAGAFLQAGPAAGALAALARGRPAR